MKKIYKIADITVKQTSKLISLASILFLLLIIFMVGKESLKIFESVSIMDFITNDRWRPLSSVPSFGIKNMILGTLMTSSLALLIATPISIGVSLLISLYIKDKYKDLMLRIIDMMAGIPSIIYGYFSFLTLVNLFEKHLSFSSGESVFIASITLSVMIFPFMVSSITESMIKIKGRYYTQAKALALSNSFIALKIILPSSLKGIIISLAIGLSRALGETMAVLMVIGNSNLTPEIFKRGITLSGLIALEMGSAVIRSDHYHGLYGAGFILMTLLIIINIVFTFILKVVKKYE